MELRCDATRMDTTSNNYIRGSLKVAPENGNVMRRSEQNVVRKVLNYKN